MPVVCRQAGLFAALMLSLMAALAQPADPGPEQWQLKKQVNDISIYVRDIDEFAIDVIRAEVEMEVPAGLVLELLLNTELRPLWNSICREAREIGEASPATGPGLIYLHYAMPWPVQDRDVVMAVEVEGELPDLTLSAKAIRGGVAVRNDRVRIVNAWETWRIIAVNDRTTRLQMTVFMDPAGPVPDWFINMMSVAEPLKMMQRLREVLRTRQLLLRRSASATVKQTSSR